MAPPLPPLWLCADLGHPAARELYDRLAAVLAVTPALVWLRASETVTTRELLAVAMQLRAVTTPSGSRLFVGDRLDVAVLSRADGVHLAERSVSTDDARRFLERFGRAPRVSRAVHDLAGVLRESSTDALVLSPFGAVPGKGRPLGANGFRVLRRAAVKTFVVALGGITSPHDAASARGAGADAIAVRRSLLDERDPARSCLALREAFELAAVAP